jgi:hypothetical protein
MKGNGPTVQEATDHYNRLTSMVASEILSVKASTKRKKARAHLISLLIATAEVPMIFIYFCFYLCELAGPQKKTPQPTD